MAAFKGPLFRRNTPIPRRLRLLEGIFIEIQGDYAPRDARSMYKSLWFQQSHGNFPNLMYQHPA
jgi:hypothetical protein